MPIVVAQGETADLVASRYGIPEAALLRTNGLASAAQVRPGTRLIIPVYNAALAASSGVHVGTRPEVAAHAAEHREHLKFVRGPAPAASAPVKEAKAKGEAKEKRGEQKIASAAHAAAKIDAKPDTKAPVAKIEKVALTELGSPARAEKARGRFCAGDNRTCGGRQDCGGGRCARIPLAGARPDHSRLCRQ